MRSLAPGIQRNVRLALIALLTAAALLWFSPAADAQFGIVRDPDVFKDGWIAQVFADDARLVTDAYSNTGGDKHDPYPVTGTGTGIYELAGGHPYIGVTDFTMRRDDPDGPPTGGNVGRVRVDVPKGLMPNPGQFTRCTDQQLKDIACPRASQIGTQAMVVYIADLAPLTGDITLKVPLYNLTPHSNPEDGPQHEVPARFGFNPAEAAEAVTPTDPLPNPLAPLLEAIAGLHPVHIVGGVRDDPAESPTFGPPDYGLYFTIDHLPEYDGSGTSPGVIRSNLTFWGVPGDNAAHDDERGVSCVFFEEAGLVEPGCTTFAPPASPTNPDPDPKTPFLNNPTHCTGTDQITRLSVWTHADLTKPPTDQIDEPTPGVVDKADGIEKHGAQGCIENVPFEGVGVAVDPQATAPDSPAGPVVSIAVPQDGLADKGKFTTSHVKDVSVTLPPGMTVNPSVANGLQACTDVQFAANAGEPGGEACPEASRIGGVSAASPLLPSASSDKAGDTDELTGSAYVGQPIPGAKYRLFVTLEAREISIRLKGRVNLDPGTGQVTAVFQNNPELPFTDLSVDLRDGPRAPLATPIDCGPKTAAATLTPWSGTAPVNAPSDPFTISGAGCPPGFAPGFAARSDNPAAGVKTPLRVTITRPDRNQFLANARVVTPPGFAGVIKGIPKCADAQAKAGTCPAASRIGTAVTRTGAGSEPFQLSGPVYLTEGYRGAPLGMVVVVRAIAGPYDLGTVVVRQAIFVDSEDAHLTVVSDPLPQILDGVPIRLRQADIHLDRKGFTYNPTSCGAKRVDSTLYPAAGGAVNRSATIAIGRCDALGFAPRMGMRLIGPRQTRFEGHPSLKTVVRAPEGQANISRVRVALPRSLALDPRNSQNVCPVADAAKADCPAATRIGFAKAVSPALNEPLRGPAYFVQGIRTDPNTGAQIRTLPSLLVKLRGEIAINLRGTTAVERNKLVSTFDRIPDAPVSEFTLRVKGGRKGPLVVSARRGICGRKQITNARMAGQNGKHANRRVNMRKPCRRPRVVFRKIRRTAKRVIVRGTIHPKATKRMRARLRCGGKVASKRVGRRGKRWVVKFRRTRRCASARKAKLVVRYPGGGSFRAAVRKRNLKLPAGS